MSHHSKNDQLNAPLARARGLGSAHHGTHHWIMQRVTSIAGIPLMVWMVWAMVDISHWDHFSFGQWLAQPLNAILVILSVITMFYHAALGAQVIVEDYVHCKCMKIATLWGLQGFFFAGAIACIFSVCKIAFAG